MRRTSLVFLLAVAGAVLLGIPCAFSRPPQEAPRKPEDPKAAPAPTDEPAPSVPAPPEKVPPREAAGLLKVPAGKHRIGISRKDFEAWVAKTKLGRKTNVGGLVEEEVSPCVGEHEVVRGNFWIGKYEVTNAQYHLFLQQAAKVEVVIPPAGQPGARTLDQVAKSFLIHPKISRRGGGFITPEAVDWQGLYDLNEEVLAPPGKENPPREAFQNLNLPPGTKLVAYRTTVPLTWRVRVKAGGRDLLRLRDTYPRGSGDQPVTGVSLLDAMACARFYGCHVPLEEEWEAACRGPQDEIHPTGEFETLGMAWNEFNIELLKAKEEAAKKKDPSKLSPRERWAMEARELEEVPPDPAVWSVGRFPLGAAPCGALDMVANADEWVSTRLYRYPNSDSRSSHLMGRCWILRGGSYHDMDTFLQATYRKFVNSDSNEIQNWHRYSSGGFRMARYHDRYGVSLAVAAAERASDPDQRILPGETDPRTYAQKFTGLSIERAMGIDRLNEVVWSSAGSPANDPEDKVFYLGQAYGLAFVPADEIPFRDVSAVGKAADGNLVHGPEKGTEKPAARRPRSLPFPGLLHVSPGVDVKGLILTRTKRTVPLSPEELKAAKEEWEKRKKEKEEAEKEGSGEDKDSGGGGEDKKDRMAGDDSKKKKGGAKKPSKEEPPKEEPPKDDGSGDKPADEPEEPEEPEEKMATTKEITVEAYEPGVLRGADFPDGLLVGWITYRNARHAALYEARLGSVSSDAPGGVVLLESPIAILDKDALEIKRRASEGTPYSRFDTSLGEVKIGVFAPSGTKGEWFEITLKLKLSEFPPGTPACPWRATEVR